MVFVTSDVFGLTELRKFQSVFGTVSEEGLRLKKFISDLYEGQEATVRTEYETTDWFRIGKEYVKAVYCHLAYLTYMQSTSCEMPG